jgi:hypothetical protein
MSLIPFGFWGNRNYSIEGLKLYYDFASSACYPGSGSTVFNLAKNDFNGTINGATFNSNDSGGSFSFDIVDDRIETSPVSFFNTEIWGANQTWEVWFKTSNTTDTMRLICFVDTLNSTFPAIVQLVVNSDINGNANAGYVYCQIRDGNNTEFRERRASINSNTSITNGNWHQLVCVLQNANTFVSNANYSTQFRIYKDGSELTPYTLAAESATNNNGILFENVDYSPWIGKANARGTVGSAPFTGSIGVVRIYNRALTNSEIALNFNQYKNRYGI